MRPGKGRSGGGPRPFRASAADVALGKLDGEDRTGLAAGPLADDVHLAAGWLDTVRGLGEAVQAR